VELSQVMIKVLMENRGAKVTVAINAAEAIEQLDRSPAYDVVLIDMQMPDMGGYEVSNYILPSENLCQIPLIAMTANASLAELQKCMEAGMTAHISKPIDELDLLSKILENSVSVARGIGLGRSLNSISYGTVENENDMAIVSPENNEEVSVGINDLDNIDSIGSLDSPSTSKGINDLDDLDDLEFK
ncbi:MAG: response regulator, partial [Gammaproteobacteria bacterium]|nr:response regulator [Gammaproteobacteria bacterium]